jgi:hypothetical protein
MLPNDVKQDDIKCKLENGLLEINLPKSEPRAIEQGKEQGRIEVSGGGSSSEESGTLGKTRSSASGKESETTSKTATTQGK